MVNSFLIITQINEYMNIMNEIQRIKILEGFLIGSKQIKVIKIDTLKYTAKTLWQIKFQIK